MFKIMWLYYFRITAVISGGVFRHLESVIVPSSGSKAEQTKFLKEFFFLPF